MRYLNLARGILSRQLKRPAVLPFAARRTALTAASLSLSAATVYWAYQCEGPLLQTVHALDKTNQAGITPDEVRAHNSIEKGIWIAVNGKVYDLTEFAQRHPGGAAIIEQYAGTNASLIFNQFHAHNLPEKYLPQDKQLGPLIGEMEPAANVMADTNEERLEYIDSMPPLSDIVCASDFEYIAQRIMTKLGYTYYATGVNDEVSLRENHNAYNRIFFKPRSLRNVQEVDLSTELLGTPVSAPFYCSAAAMAKMGHEDGELSIARACGKENIMQMICHQASYSIDDIRNQVPGQPQWAQIIPLNKNHAIRGIKDATRHNVASIFVTVDVPIIGKRDKDERVRSTIKDGSLKQLEEQGIVANETCHCTWDDLVDYQKESHIPLMIKGLQSAEDIVEAAERGYKACVISNHGGRQLDFARSPLETLADVMPILKERGLDKSIEVYVDGGVRRGSDILKAIALGAKGVGLGRNFLYANACYGEAGVQKLISILKDEMTRDMMMLGVTSLDQLGPEYIDIRNLHMRPQPVTMSYDRNYVPPGPPLFANEK